MKRTHRIPAKKAALAVACLLVVYFLVTLVPALLAPARAASVPGSLPPIL